ncbi:MAG: hypothetical protein HC900_06985 [Methylacidiphilales bacterium]|nr:hypothetical protein [Candidatus Methylacidiphilales bacterium]
MSEIKCECDMSCEHLNTMSLVEIIARLEEKARRVSSVAGYCLSMARLELEQAAMSRPVNESRKSLN